MIRVLTLLAVLSGPAAAQSIYPALAGSRYCELRRLGVNHDQALTVSIRENLSPRKPVMVTIGGRPYSTDQLDFANWIQKCR